MSFPQISVFSWRLPAVVLGTDELPPPPRRASKSSKSSRSSKSSQSSQPSQSSRSSQTSQTSQATQVSQGTQTSETALVTEPAQVTQPAPVTQPAWAIQTPQTSQVVSIPTSQTPSTPVSPPARLYLRNILPTCPEGMPTPPPPPRKPYPWLWQCHSCHTVYRIGCTRRCLVCSHEYCISPPPPTTTARRGSKRRRRPTGSCASEFDYGGWAEWGAWRRKVLGLEATAGANRKQRERAFVAKTHNCMEDCDYPSECNHVRHRTLQEVREAEERRQLQQLQAPLPPQEPRQPPPPVVATRPVNPDDELPLNEAIEVLENVPEGEELKSPTSPLRSSFFFFDDPDEVDVPEGEDAPNFDNEWPKKRKTNPSGIDQRISDEQNEAGPSTVNTRSMDEDMLRSLIDEDEKMMPLDFFGSVLARCRSRMSGQEHPKRTGKLTVRNLTEADKRNESDSSSDSDSDSSSSASEISSTGSDVEWLSASDSTNLSEESALADEDESEDESDEEIDALVAAGRSFLRD